MKNKIAHTVAPSNLTNSVRVWKFYRTYGYNVPFIKIVML